LGRPQHQAGPQDDIGRGVTAARQLPQLINLFGGEIHTGPTKR
ncbi:hypothetical protein SAMN02787144_106710, partial [Streptomyces atratus]